MDFSRISDRFVLIVVPISIAACLFAIYQMQSEGVVHELLLSTPRVAAGGRALPMRAIVFDQVESMTGPRMLSCDVDVELRRASRVLSRSRLVRASAGGMEGALVIPADAPRGDLDVHASARRGRVVLATVDTKLRVVGSDRPLPLERRAQGALQQLGAGKLEGDAALTLDARIRGGTCVPEQPCELLVLTRGTQGHLAVRGSSNVTVVSGSVSAVPEVESISRARLVVHGPEGVVYLELSGARGSGKREIRLPVDLGSVSILVQPSQGPRLPSFEVSVPTRSAAVVVFDLFRDGLWTETHALNVRPGTTHVASPFRHVSPGLVRIQAHAGLLGETSAAAALFVVLEPNEKPSPELELQYRFAADEEWIYRSPPPVSGYLQATLGLRKKHSKLTTFTVIVMVLAAALVFVLLLRRGLRAAKDARAILEAAGDPDARSFRHRVRMTLSVVLFSLTVGLAILAAVMLAVARSGGF